MADKDFRVKLGIEVGANASIAGAITTVDSIQFDLAAGVDIPALGQFAWNADDNTVSLGLGVASLQLGQEEFIFIKNQSGETIGNGNTVMFAGTVGSSGRILGRKGVADGSFPSKYFIISVLFSFLAISNGVIRLLSALFLSAPASMAKSASL